jgi:hypothetical protein
VKQQVEHCLRRRRSGRAAQHLAEEGLEVSLVAAAEKAGEQVDVLGAGEVLHGLQNPVHDVDLIPRAFLDGRGAVGARHPPIDDLDDARHGAGTEQPAQRLRAGRLIESQPGLQKVSKDRHGLRASLRRDPAQRSDGGIPQPRLRGRVENTPRDRVEADRAAVVDELAEKQLRGFPIGRVLVEEQHNLRHMVRVQRAEGRSDEPESLRVVRCGSGPQRLDELRRGELREVRELRRAARGRVVFCKATAGLGSCARSSGGSRRR